MSEKWINHPTHREAITGVKEALTQRYNHATLNDLFMGIAGGDEVNGTWTYFDEAIHRYYDMPQHGKIPDFAIMEFIKEFNKPVVDN